MVERLIDGAKVSSRYFTARRTVMMKEPRDKSAIIQYDSYTLDLSNPPVIRHEFRLFALL